jgi:hypothetical protein
MMLVKLLVGMVLGGLVKLSTRKVNVEPAVIGLLVNVKTALSVLVPIKLQETALVLVPLLQVTEVGS